MANWTALCAWLKTHFNRSEIYLLSALFVPTVLIFCFGSLATEMLEGETMTFDRTVLLALRIPGDTASPIGPDWLESIFVDITSMGSTTILTFFTAVAIIYLLLAHKGSHALLVFISAVGGALISTGLKNLFERPRPDFVAHIVEVSSASFPSGHALNSAVIYLTLGVLLARVENNFRLRAFIMGLAVFCTLAIGISRVYLGVHYPTDVLAGWILGTGWAMLCLVAMLWLEKQMTDSKKA